MGWEVSIFGGWHIGRSFTGTRIEDDCPCVKAPCGLVDVGGVSEDCLQHQITKTIRQSHTSSQCPGVANE